MIERLIDIIVGVWDELVPVVVVDAYEAGVILRLGKYHKDLKPGLNFKVPFIDNPIGTVVVTTTLHLDPQTITTADGEDLVVSTIVKYNIDRDKVKEYLLKITDRTDVLCDVTMGAVRDAVSECDLEFVFSGDALEKEVHKRVRKQTLKYGFNVEKITFATLASVQTFRLMLDGSLAGESNDV